MGCGEALRKVFRQLGEGASQGRGSGDKNIIGTLMALQRQNGGGGGPQASFGPVAGDRIADFAAGGETQAQAAVPGFGIGGVADFED